MLRITLLEEQGPDHEIEIPSADTTSWDVLDGDLSVFVDNESLPESLQQKDITGWETVVSDWHQIATGDVQRVEYLSRSRVRLVIRFTRVKQR